MIAGRREDDPIGTSRFFDESRRFFGARLILPRVERELEISGAQQQSFCTICRSDFEANAGSLFPWMSSDALLPANAENKRYRGFVLLRTNCGRNRAHSIEIKRVGHEDGWTTTDEPISVVRVLCKARKVAGGDDRAESMASRERVEHPEFECVQDYRAAWKPCGSKRAVN